jgi:hypothetical protein
VTLQGGVNIAVIGGWSAAQPNQVLEPLLEILVSRKPLLDHLTTFLHQITELQMDPTPVSSPKPSPVKKRVSSSRKETDSEAEPVSEPSSTKRDLLDHNFFAFDEMTERQTEHRGECYATEAGASFHASINWARDLFQERKEVSKLVLKNHCGTMLCQKRFGQESFFQSPTCKVEDIDHIASRCLQVSEHGTK